MNADWPMFQRLDAESQQRLSNFWCRALGITPGPHTRHFSDGLTADDHMLLQAHHQMVLRTRAVDADDAR